MPTAGGCGAGSASAGTGTRNGGCRHGATDHFARFGKRRHAVGRRHDRCRTGGDRHAPARRTGAGLASPRVAVDVGGAGRGGRACRARAARARRSRSATGWASGRRTAPSGPCCSSRVARVGRDPRRRQPRIPPKRTRVRAQPVRRAAARHRRGVQDVELSRHARPGARRPARAGAGGHHRHRASRPRRRPGVGRLSPDSASIGGLDLLREREASLDCDDPINIQYTSGTTGNPKGATLTHHNILNNGRLSSPRRSATPRRTACASPCRCTTASAWASATSAASRAGPRWCTRRPASSRWPRWRRSRRSGARASTGCRRCSSRNSSTREFAELRPHVASHRDHGRRAVPDRGDEACDQRDALHRDRHRLRHDRDRAGVVHERAATTTSTGGSAPSAP